MIEVKTKIITKYDQDINGTQYRRYQASIPKAFAELIQPDKEGKATVHTLLYDDVYLLTISPESLNTIVSNLDKIFNGE